mgnify:CR=1 FL=1
MVDGKDRSQSGGNRVLSNLTAMGIFGVLNTSFVVSYVSLIFSPSCPEYFAAAVALFLLGGCIVSICLASFSSLSLIHISEPTRQLTQSRIPSYS